MSGNSFGFSPELDDRLRDRIDEIRKKSAKPWIAAFDADGTIWNTDVGESFFQFQISYCQLPHLPENPWQHYQDMKKIDHRQAYLWLAQISAGQAFSLVQQWAREAVAKAAPLPIFAPQAKLIAYLKSRSFDIYIVTASVQWAVVPAAHLLGVPPDHVLGVQTAIRDGLVTTEQDGEMTWREGKATALLKATHGIHPQFCVGNTIGDTALLQAAQHTRLAVCSSGSVGELAEAEEALQEIARREHWLTHQF